MLVIRLARTGRKNLAAYRIVAADSRRAASGKYVARLGHYNPHTKEAVYNKAELEAFIKKGAQPSGAIVKLLKKDKVTLPKWAQDNLIVKKKAPKQKTEAAEGDKAPAAEKPPESEAAADTKATDDKKVEEKPADEPKADQPEAATKPDKPPETA